MAFFRSGVRPMLRPLPLGFSPHNHEVNLIDPDVEDVLNGVFDLSFIGFLSTMKVYLLSANKPIDFSVTIGLIIISR